MRDRNQTGNMRYETLDSVSCLLFRQDRNDFDLRNLTDVCYLPSAYASQTRGSDGDERGEKFATEGHDYLR